MLVLARPNLEYAIPYLYLHKKGGCCCHAAIDCGSMDTYSAPIKDHTGDIKGINPNPRSVVNPLSDEQFTVGGL